MIRIIKAYSTILYGYGKIDYNNSINKCVTFRFNRHFPEYPFEHPMLNTPRKYKKLLEGEVA